MGTDAQHLLLATLDGHADLAIPELGVLSRDVSIRLDPQALCVEAFLDRSDAVVEALAQERRSFAIHLNNVVLRNAGTTVPLKADELLLYRSNPLSEWPECIGWLDSALELGDTRERRLELKPSAKELAFIADEAPSTEHPYQIYYGGACTGLRAPSPLEHPSVSAAISFCCNHPQRGLLCAFSSGDFFSVEARIRAAWMLIHGRMLTLALQIKGREIRFYGHEAISQSSYLPLATGWDSTLPEGIMNGFASMEQDRFGKAYLALKYFLAGKQADIWLEARYMLLMTCIEAMDGEETRQLREECTAAVLGVSSDAAFLFNCMRNQLVHGCGGYQQAFAAFLKEDLKGRPFRPEPEFELCVKDGKLDFAQLWMRLCERLDAFWCAYLSVPAALVSDRYAQIPLMPAVDLQRLDDAIALLKQKKEESKVLDAQKTADRRQELKVLKERVAALEEQLKAVTGSSVHLS